MTFIHKIINLKANPIPYREMVHFKPFNDNGNVRCLNGDAHARRTTDINKVTCIKCLNPNTGKNFWHRHEEKRGNQHKNF